jgi:signal transduction histidine kinase
MRERLLATFVLLTVITVVLYGVPRAFIVAELATESLRRDVARAASIVGANVTTEELAGRQLTEAALARDLGPDDHVTWVGNDGTSLTAGQPFQETDERDIVAEGAVDGLGYVRLVRPASTVNLAVFEAVLPIALIGLALIAASVVAGWVLAARLSRPFRQLADAAERLGEGDFEVSTPDKSVREANAIARALRTSARQLAESLRREREFASNASHQLRTPLTGLRLRLEDLTMWDEVPDAVRDELEASIGEVDRLADTVTGLLELGRHGNYGGSVRVDVADLARNARERWQPVAALSERNVVLGQLHPATIAVPEGAVGQALDVLVSNGLRHGEGEVTIETFAEREHVRIRVRDQGPGVPEASSDVIFERHVKGERSSGDGIGLPLARDVAASFGGSIAVLSGPPTTFDLLLPLDR